MTTPSACIPLPFAFNSYGHLVHANSPTLQRGKACDCKCVGCNEPLVLKRGPIKSPHFSHQSGSKCAGGVGFLHKCAQMVLANYAMLPVKSPDFKGSYESSVLGNRYALLGQKINLPSSLEFTSTALEDRLILPGFVVDFSATTPSTAASRLIIEVRDTHPVDEKKRRALLSLGIPALEIDISGIRGNPDITSSMENFVNYVWYGAPRNWIVSLPEYVSQYRALHKDLRHQVHEMEKKHLAHEQAIRLSASAAMIRARSLRGIEASRRTCLKFQQQCLAS